jgi:hypothetical protein
MSVRGAANKPPSRGAGWRRCHIRGGANDSSKMIPIINHGSMRKRPHGMGFMT